jgi:hypothetical protein
MFVSAVAEAIASTAAYEAVRVCLRALTRLYRVGNSWNMCPAFPQP